MKCGKIRRDEGYVNRWLVRIIVLVAIPVAILILLIIKREPEYHGKTAAVWFKEMQALKQTEALDAFQAMGPKGTATLEKALESPHTNDRFKAAWALGQLGPSAREAAPLLVKAIGDQNKSVQYYSIISIGLIDPMRDDLIPVLIKCLGDTNKSISSVSAGLLKKIEKERQDGNLSPPFTNEVDYDMAFVRSRAPNVQLMGIDRLVTLQMPDKTPEIVDTLESLLKSDNPNVALHARTGLRHFGVDLTGTNNNSTFAPK